MYVFPRALLVSCFHVETPCVEVAGQYRQNFFQLMAWLEKEYPELTGLVHGPWHPLLCEHAWFLTASRTRRRKLSCPAATPCTWVETADGGALPCPHTYAYQMIASLVGYLQLAAFAVALFGRQVRISSVPRAGSL